MFHILQLHYELLNILYLLLATLKKNLLCVCMWDVKICSVFLTKIYDFLLSFYSKIALLHLQSCIIGAGCI